jgi:hypothetical protein
VCQATLCTPLLHYNIMLPSAVFSHTTNYSKGDLNDKTSLALLNRTTTPH